MSELSILRSPMLTREGFRHGFALRTGGVSEGPYASLNLGRAIGDVPDAVEQNHERLRRALPYSTLYEVTQVHGRAVRVVSGVEAPADVRREAADALAGRRTGLALGIRVADCAPVFLADRRTGAIAVAHAGWRGAALGIVEASVSALAEAFGTQPGDLLAVIGPHIRAARFEVGPEVAAALAASAPGAAVVDRRHPKPHVSLAAVLTHQLLGLGVPRAQIDDLGGCTYDEPQRFFSYRRDHGRTGRHLAVLVGR